MSNKIRDLQKQTEIEFGKAFQVVQTQMLEVAPCKWRNFRSGAAE
jgi:hypothetical protein